MIKSKLKWYQFMKKKSDFKTVRNVKTRSHKAGETCIVRVVKTK